MSVVPMDLYWIWRGSGEREGAAVRCLSCRRNLVGHAVLDRVWSGCGRGWRGGRKRGKARQGRRGEGFGLSRSLLLLLRDSGNLWHAHAIAGALDHTGGGGDGGLTGAWKAQRRARRREEGTWSGGTLFSWLWCRLRGVEESLSLLGEGGDERAGSLLGIAKPAGMEGGGGAWSLQ